MRIRLTSATTLRTKYQNGKSLLYVSALPLLTSSQVKELFKKYDADKSAALSLDEMKKMMHDLRDDVCIIGKVPNLTDEEVRDLA